MRTSISGTGTLSGIHEQPRSGRSRLHPGRPCDRNQRVNITDVVVLADEDFLGHDAGKGLILTPGSTTIDPGETFVRGNAGNAAVDVGNPSFSIDIAAGCP